MSQRVYLAIDLGAESGRVMAGLWNGKTIRLEEVHRFPNGPVYLGDSLRWDVVRLWAEIQTGLGLAAIGSTIHPYPTQAEGVKKLADAYNRTRVTPFVKKMLSAWLAWQRKRP